MESRDQKKKPYFPPTLTRLTREQTKKLVVDRKNCSEEEAADLLEIPPDNGNQNTATDQSGNAQLRCRDQPQNRRRKRARSA
jgi:hypothetical protein